MKNNVILLVVILITIISCKENSKSKTSESKEHQKEVVHKEHKEHWTYGGETGPEHWSEIEKKSDCNGKRQSPINIIDFDAKVDSSLNPIDVHYSNKVKIHDVTNNGHSIQYNFESGDYIVVNGEQFDLKQIHFHEASEHTINGVRFPLEMHLVHASKNNTYAVLAVMAIEGEGSEPFTFLENYLPIKVNETKPVDANFDLNLNLPENKSYYAYGGSLTTPPCTESVSWFVFKTPISVSLKQVQQLQELMPFNNYRNEQPLNERVVTQYVN